MRKFVAAVAAGVVAVLSFAASASAADQGASACQPAAGQETAAIAQAVGGIGPIASAIAMSQPGAIAALNQISLFSCT
jgi:hypothetical protein